MFYLSEEQLKSIYGAISMYAVDDLAIMNGLYMGGIGSILGFYAPIALLGWGIWCPTLSFVGFGTGFYLGYLRTYSEYSGCDKVCFWKSPLRWERISCSFYVKNPNDWWKL